MKQIEKAFNFGIGLVLLNNLYLLSGLTRIPNVLVISISLLISIYYTFANWNSVKSTQLLLNWFTFFSIFFSLFLFTIDYFFNESAIRINDTIRILLYAFYFTWTYLLFAEKEQLLNWIKKLAIWSIFVLILQGLFEYYQPYLWTFMLSENVEKRTVGRIAGSLIDSNSYACSLIIYYLIYFKENQSSFQVKKLLALLGLFFIVAYLNDISGSRQGLLLILLFLGYLLFENLSVRNLKYVIIFCGLIVVLSLLFNQQILDYANQNPHSSVGRILSSTDNKASQSNLDREHSIYAGILFLSENYFLIGPGMLNFASRWENFTTVHEPHIGFLFLIVQYGVLSLVLFYIYYLSFIRSSLAKVNMLFWAIFIHIALQPNTVYYAISFFVFFYIDAKYFTVSEMLILPDNNGDDEHVS